MAGGIGALFIDLGINTATFISDINRVNQNLDSMSKKANVALANIANSFNSGRDSLNKFGEKMFSAEGIMTQLAGEAGLGLLIHKAIEFASTLSDTAKAVGVSTAQLQGYQFAAMQSGVHTDQLSTSLSNFVKNVGEAQQGDGSLVSALKDHNITLLENIRHAADQDEAFRLVADAIKNSKTATDAAVIANAAFGRGGVAMVNMLKDGSAGLLEFAGQAKATGNIMDASLIETTKEAGDKLAVLADSGMKQVTIEVAKLSPQIINLAQTFINLLPTLIKIGDVIVTGLVMPFKGLGMILDYTEIGLVRTQQALGQISKQVADEQIKLMGQQAQESTKNIEAMNKALKDTAATQASNAKASGTSNATVSTTNNPNLNMPTLAQIEAQKQAMAAAAKAQEELNKRAQQAFDDTRTSTEQYEAKLNNLEDLLSRGAITWETFDRGVAQAKADLDAHNESLQKAKDIFDQTRTPLEQFQAQLTELNSLVSTGAITMDTYDRAIKQATDDLDEHNKQLKDAKKVFEDTRTPFEQYQTDIDKLNDMMNKGAIDWDTYNRAILQASTGLDQHIGLMDGAKSIMDNLLTGQIHSWGDLGKTAMKALDDIMGNMLKMTMSGGSGGLGGLVSSIFGNAASGGNTGGGLGASIGGLLSKAGSSIAGAFSSFGGFFADGGNFSGGKPIVVGERGPEMIVPRSSGTVIPNGGTRPIQLNYYVSTPNADSFKRSQGQMAAEATMVMRNATRNL